MRPDDLREAASALEDRDPGGEAAGAVDALRAAAAEIERLRAALRGCVEAHEMGRYEPAQAAYEAARQALGVGKPPATP